MVKDGVALTENIVWRDLLRRCGNCLAPLAALPPPRAVGPIQPDAWGGGTETGEGADARMADAPA